MILGYVIIFMNLVYAIILASIFFMKKRVLNIETKIFSTLIISNIVGFILEAICGYLISKLPNFELPTYIINKVFIFNLCFWITSFTFYVVSICFGINNIIKKFKSIRLKVFMSLLLALLFILSFALPINFYNDGTYVYTYGPAVDLTVFLCLIYLLIDIISIVTNFKKISKIKLVPLLILIIGFIVIFIIRQINPGLVFMSTVFYIVLFFMYFTIENPDLKLINQLEYAKNMAEKANRAKSDFLSSMSHEIRTPLNAIVGLSECIKNSDDIEEIHEDANDVVMASNNLLEIVNGILDISKIEADKMEIIESNYNPVEVFGEITSLIELKLDEKNLKLNCNFAEDIPDTLYGDKGKLKQIISNILSNAIKYTEKGHINFNVTCINEKDKCKLQIIITDTGRGIKSDQLDKIFNKFERAEEDKNSTIEGTGLGLAITKSLVEMMGGKILVHSTYGEGSKFTVLLEQKYSKDEETTKVVRDDKVSYSDKRALIVDDNKLNIKVASKVLSEFELNIDSADSGFNAIKKIENNEHYDIIFMDIMMPKMSGVETLKKLKEINNFNTPVVALTADAMEGKSTKYIEVGFSEYLSKPMSKEELKRVLNKCLNGNSDNIEEQIIEKDPNIHRVIPITDEDIEELNKLFEISNTNE